MMIARICKVFRFEAAHRLPLHPGKCKSLHGHSYRMEVEVSGEIDEATGMVCDFDVIKRAAKELLDRWDHSDLNIELVGPPTAERIAVEAFKWLAFIDNDGTNARLQRVRIWETDTCWAEVRRGEMYG